MSIKLKKKYFSRNRDREEEYGSNFNKASSSINFFINVVLVIITGFFAPAVIITSLTSKDMMLMLANILLSAGYLTNFFYQIYSNKLSRSEVLISLLSLTLALTVSFHFFPVITTWNLINVISFANFAATAINGFFLIRKIIVSPFKKLLDYIALSCGFEINGNFFNPKNLSPHTDRFVIDRLFRKHYDHDYSQSLNQGMNIKQKLRPFNNMIKKLCEYLNKYNEDLFGSITNSDNINNTEKLIAQLSLKGNSSNCIIFFQEKINFKQSKITLLKEASANIDKAIKDIDNKEPFESVVKKMKFFDSFKYQRIDTDRFKLFQEAKECLSKEISRQETKLYGDKNGHIGLMQCIPKP